MISLFLLIADAQALTPLPLALPANDKYELLVEGTVTSYEPMYVTPLREGDPKCYSTKYIFKVNTTLKGDVSPGDDIEIVWPGCRLSDGTVVTMNASYSVHPNKNDIIAIFLTRIPLGLTPISGQIFINNEQGEASVLGGREIRFLEERFYKYPSDKDYGYAATSFRAQLTQSSRVPWSSFMKFLASPSAINSHEQGE